MLKKCQNVDLGGSPGKCQKHVEHVEKHIKMLILEGSPGKCQKHIENGDTMLDMFKKMSFWDPKLNLLTFFSHFPGGPKSTPPVPHLTFCLIVSDIFRGPSQIDILTFF